MTARPTARPATREQRRPGSTRRTVSTRESGSPGHRRYGPLVALLLAVGLVLVTVGVVSGGALLMLDDRVLALTPGRGGGPRAAELVALGIVDLATPVLSVAVLCAVTFAVCLRTGRWTPLVVAGPALVLVSGSVLLGKAVITRSAPDVPGMLGGDGSYPSGHTATALVCAGVAAELLSRLQPARRRLARAAAATWTTLVAGALLWLHFHWLSDVVGSALLATLVLWLLLRWPARLGARLETPASPLPVGRPGADGAGRGREAGRLGPPWLDWDRSGAR
ncbi:phosphatase PAP2 family protein [Terrabacter sp. C0L_2]|uniref:phosphatase PAP2 family protein n=1 Tax=Terrabacter sp. C0L_2 TaxID=3108389 RepID=UPI002ED24629|nr:phosphatase PAP2 family protein [Terrabacter sp. C0L_2]